MRHLAAALVLLAAGLSPTAARAVDLSGDWVIDKPAFRQQLNRVMAEFVARMPADVADRLRAQGVDPAEMISTDAMSEADRYSVAFLKDGTIKLTDLAPEDESGGEDGAEALPPDDEAGSGPAGDDGEGDLEGEGSDQASMSGQWQLDGSTLHVELPQGDSMRNLEGTVKGDRIELHPVADPDDPDMAQFAGFTVPLIRKR